MEKEARGNNESHPVPAIQRAAANLRKFECNQQDDIAALNIYERAPGIYLRRHDTYLNGPVVTGPFVAKVAPVLCLIC